MSSRLYAGGCPGNRCAQLPTSPICRCKKADCSRDVWKIRVKVFFFFFYLQNSVGRASDDESSYARGPHLSQADGPPDVAPLRGLHVVLVGQKLSHRQTISLQAAGGHPLQQAGVGGGGRTWSAAFPGYRPCECTMPRFRAASGLSRRSARSHSSTARL